MSSRARWHRRRYRRRRQFPDALSAQRRLRATGKPLVYGAVHRFDGQVSVFDAGAARRIAVLPLPVPGATAAGPRQLRRSGRARRAAGHDRPAAGDRGDQAGARHRPAACGSARLLSTRLLRFRERIAVRPRGGAVRAFRGYVDAVLRAIAGCAAANAASCSGVASVWCVLSIPRTARRRRFARFVARHGDACACARRDTSRQGNCGRSPRDHQVDVLHVGRCSSSADQAPECRGFDPEVGRSWQGGVWRLLPDLRRPPPA